MEDIINKQFKEFCDEVGLDNTGISLEVAKLIYNQGFLDGNDFHARMSKIENEGNSGNGTYRELPGIWAG